MDTPTHVLIPVIVYGLMRQEGLTSGGSVEKMAIVRTAVIIGIVGAMPDAMDPHRTLEERLNSWSHSLLACVGFSALFFGVSLVRDGWVSRWFALGLGATYFSHVVGDAVAGGVGWSYPFFRSVIGDYYIPPEWWIPLDLVCVVVAYLVYRVVPKRRWLLRNRRTAEERLAEILEES